MATSPFRHSPARAAAGRKAQPSAAVPLQPSPARPHPIAGHSHLAGATERLVAVCQTAEPAVQEAMCEWLAAFTAAVGCDPAQALPQCACAPRGRHASPPPAYAPQSGLHGAQRPAGSL